MLLDSTIALAERSRIALDTKVKRLKAAAVLLVLAAGVLVAGTIVQSIGG